MCCLPLRTYSWPGISCYAGHEKGIGVPIGSQIGLNRRVNSPKISRIRPTLPQSAPRTFIRNKSERKLRFTTLLPRASLAVPEAEAGYPWFQGEDHGYRQFSEVARTGSTFTATNPMSPHISMWIEIRVVASSGLHQLHFLQVLDLTPGSFGRLNGLSARIEVFCLRHGRSFMANPGERVIEAACTEDKLVVDLADGRSISVPLA